MPALSNSASFERRAGNATEYEIMKKILLLSLCAAMMSAMAAASRAENVVREFSGTASAITAEFSVDGPWLLDWRVNSEYSRFMAVDIVLLDGKTGYQVGKIRHKKEPDNGLRLFETGGSYKLRIDSSHTRWYLKVIQITAEEAKLYTPKDSG